ncbi:MULTISPECIES: hypothetical protein [unclassified Streptomyces]|uniref:hypothetical protein n=1 Tax=unclassified Streptomyces TaxID=2593676 RepID=UPI00081EC4CD|nr:MULTISPECIES: hypothetical protein [unclassified Streptomyces]MYR27789.1 hypothetical protein [Streptomyces sp. SID4945]SCF29396.1 hypothetical protein GA0115257_110312 [Streptomyces sp. LcepLS]
MTTSYPPRARGWLIERGHDLSTLVTLGWRPAPLWVKAAAVAWGAVLAFLALVALGGLLLSWGRALPWTLPTLDDPTGLLATLDDPIHRYLAAHTRTLPTSATTVYATWQATGLLALALGWLGITAARATWLLWGAATVAMTAAGTPAPDRPVALALALLAWTVLSLIALRGLHLRRDVIVHHLPAPPAPAPQLTAHLHLPEQKPAARAVLRPYDPREQPPPTWN